MNKFGILKMAKLPLLMLVIISIILFAERVGVQVKTSNSTSEYLPSSILSKKVTNDKLDKECLLLYDSNDDYYKGYIKQAEYILQKLSVGYTEYNIANLKGNIAFSKYSTAVICTPDFSNYKNNLLPLFDWVNDGGRMMVFEPFEPTPITNTMLSQMGVEETKGEYTIIEGLTIKTDFMIGSKNFNYKFDDDGEINVVNLNVNSDTTVHVVSDTKIPLLWEREYGEGRIVVNNLGAFGKSFRGYYASAYSLLQDAFAYPVINSSVFFLDDFPAPIPTGYNKYVSKYYNRDVESFYTDIWWPDMQDLSKRYGIKYTGVMIEDYNNTVKAPFYSNSNTSKMINLGNTLLNLGGEIGYHGYNHQPLCYGNFNFLDKVNYKTWKSVEDSKKGFDMLVQFGKLLFPSNNFQVYVPPSNILSADGRGMLVKNFPQIKIISGVYQLEDYEYEQEFDVSSDGIINLPRCVSGTEIEGYERWVALNQLSFQYVNTHFFHPDDVLDEDRGAAKGWSAMYKTLEDYVKWLSDVSPNLRNQTATDAAKAVQRYDAISIERELKNGKLKIKINNYYDGAYLIIRIREGKPTEISGGSLEELGTGLYSLNATSDKVEINIE